MRHAPSKTTIVSAAIAATALLAAAPNPAAAQDKGPRAPALDLDEMVRYRGSDYERGVEYQPLSDYGQSWSADQQPAHEVDLDAFHLDTHEVTVREFALFLSHAAGELHYHDDQPIDRVEDGYLPAEGTAREPIRQVTWRAARDYCRWEGKRLPTEAEWEFAARGAPEYTYPWGDESPNCERANHFTGRSFCEGKPVEVGSHPEGAFVLGTQDLAGNVAEWTADWYSEYPEDLEEPLDNPTGPEDGTYKVVRGGSFLSNSNYLRSAARRAVLPDRHSEGIGFRCAISDSATGESDDVARGELALPADENREDHDRFPAPAAETADTVADGLENPQSLVSIDGTLYVMDRGAGSVVEIAPESGETNVVADELNGIRGLATDGNRLYATDAESNAIHEIIPGMPTSEFASLDQQPGPLAIRDGQLFVGTSTSLLAFDLDSGEETLLADGLANVTHVAASSSTVVFAADGDGNMNDAELSSVPVGGGDKTMLLHPKDDVEPEGRTDIIVSGLTYHSSGENFYYMLARQGFPRHGYLARTDGESSSLNILTHTPPNPGILEQAGDRLFWQSSRNVAGLNTPVEGSYFRFPGKWAQIGDVHADSNRVVWTDVHTGQVKQMQR